MMKDGYYLSTYIEIDPLNHIIKTCARHDLNLSLWKKVGCTVSLVHYWELERLSGLRYHELPFFDREQAIELINRLLASYNLSFDDMVEVWGTPGLDTVDDYHSVNDYKGIAYHSISHLFSGILYDSDLFYNSNIIGLAVDGGPDTVVDLDGKRGYVFVGCVVQKGQLNIFPIESPGPLWTQSRHKFNMREGSLMALASASSSQGHFSPVQFSCLKEESIRDTYRLVDRIVEEANSFSDGDIGHKLNGFDQRFSRDENIASMVMKEIQTISIKKMEQTLTNIIEDYQLNPNETYLSLTGGYALNCPANSHLIKSFGFKGLISPPCVNDGGQSLGIALYAFYKKLQPDRISYKFEGAYLGDEDDSLANVLASEEFSPFIASVDDLDFTQAIADLKLQPIIWFDGKAELGPRALGNRSILADPRQEASQVLLNKVKQREWWRPVAPIVIEEKAAEWFEDACSSPFMLQTFKIREDKLKYVPAIAHIDLSARVQTVNPSQNKALYDLLQAFYVDTGVPILCNTSLNDKAEPIVNRITEAINFCLRKGIKVGYFNQKRVCFKDFAKYTQSNPYPRQLNLFVKHTEQETSNMLRELNPHHLDSQVLRAYAWSRDLRTQYDITKERDAKIVDKLVKLWILQNEWLPTV